MAPTTRRKPRRGTKWLMPWVFVMALLAVGRWMRPDPDPYGEYSNKQQKKHGFGMDATQRCDAMLDRFDAVFNERRRARQLKVLHSESYKAMMTRTPPEPGKKRDRFLEQVNQRFFDNYEPEANCFTDERFGFEFDVQPRWRKNKTMIAELYEKGSRYDSFGDGPKFLCGVDVIRNRTSSENKCLVYSIGSNNNIGFEMAMDKLLGCETHTFDPTVANFVGGDYATFHQWGLGEDGVEAKHRKSRWTAKSFEAIVRELGHQGRTIDVLKIDCEGCEWEALPPVFDAMAAGTIKIHQMQIEMHKNVPISKTRDVFFEKLDKAGMRIFHKERNQWGCDGWKCLEYAFVSEEFLRIANKAAVCDS